MVGAVSITSCSANDLACLCTSSAYIKKAVTCIHDTCSPTDATNSYNYATFACNSAGVQVPSVESVLNGSSSPAPAPAPAPATTPAPPPAPAQARAASSTTPIPSGSASAHPSVPASSSASAPSSNPVVTFSSGSMSQFVVSREIVVGVVAALAIFAL